MASQQCDETDKFGEWLFGYLADRPQYQRYSIYYDHCGQNAVEIKGIFDKDKPVSRKNKLAEVDVMVTEDKAIVILIEIEKSDTRPKILLGDVFASLMSTCFAVLVEGKNEYFDVTPETNLFIVFEGTADRHKSRIIKSALARFLVSDDGIKPENVYPIEKDNLASAIETLKEKVQETLHKHQSAG